MRSSRASLHTDPRGSRPIRVKARGVSSCYAMAAFLVAFWLIDAGSASSPILLPSEEPAVSRSREISGSLTGGELHYVEDRAADHQQAKESDMAIRTEARFRTETGLPDEGLGDSGENLARGSNSYRGKNAIGGTPSLSERTSPPEIQRQTNDFNVYSAGAFWDQRSLGADLTVSTSSSDEKR